MKFTPDEEKNIHAQKLGRLGGLKKSPAKTEAARRNAALPRKPKTKK
jgi:hypothetical protein